MELLGFLPVQCWWPWEAEIVVCSLFVIAAIVIITFATIVIIIIIIIIIIIVIIVFVSFLNLVFKEQGLRFEVLGTTGCYWGCLGIYNIQDTRYNMLCTICNAQYTIWNIQYTTTVACMQHAYNIQYAYNIGYIRNTLTTVNKGWFLLCVFATDVSGVGRVLSGWVGGWVGWLMGRVLVGRVWVSGWVGFGVSKMLRKHWFDAIWILL